MFVICWCCVSACFVIVLLDSSYFVVRCSMFKLVIVSIATFWYLFVLI